MIQSMYIFMLHVCLCLQQSGLAPRPLESGQSLPIHELDLGKSPDVRISVIQVSYVSPQFTLCHTRKHCRPACKHCCPTCKQLMLF